MWGKSAVALVAMLLAVAQAQAELKWLPAPGSTDGGAPTATTAGMYTIERATLFSDGNNVIVQIKTKESFPRYGCALSSSQEPNTLFSYSNPYATIAADFLAKAQVAQMNGYKVRFAVNPGTTNWCHPYGIGLWGLDMVVP